MKVLLKLKWGGVVVSEECSWKRAKKFLVGMGVDFRDEHESNAVVREFPRAVGDRVGSRSAVFGLPFEWSAEAIGYYHGEKGAAS